MNTLNVFLVQSLKKQLEKFFLITLTMPFVATKPKIKAWK